MKTDRRLRAWSLGAVFGVTLALFFWPVTHWLVRSQITLALAPHRFQNALSELGIQSVSTVPTRTGTTVSDIARRHPDNPGIQFVDASRRREGETDTLPAMERVRALLARFPDDPALCANALRLATLSAVVLHREEADLLEGRAPAAAADRKSFPDRTECLLWFDKVAATGERLEPENAYFPFLRAVGLFEGHHDDEALAALRRASRKSAWKEHYALEVEGDWQVQAAIYGHSSAVVRTLSAASLLFPHYSRLRAACRVALYKAVEAERAGEVRRGFAIRQTIMHCGSLMRREASSILGGLVGRALVNLAMQRPGGAAAQPSPNTPDQDEERVSAAFLNAYKTYLESAGLRAEVGWIEAEWEAGNRFKALTKEGAKYSPFDAPYTHLLYGWLIGMALLVSAFWMLVFAGGAALLGQSRSLQQGERLAPFLRKALPVSLLAGWVGAAPGGAFYAIGLFLLLLVAGVRSQDTTLSRRQRLGIPFLTALGSGLVVALFVLLVQNLMAFSRLGSAIQNLQGPSDENSPFVVQTLLWWILALPPILLALIGLVSRALRVPLTVGMVRGLRGLALPVAGLLLLGYSVSALVTLRLEQQVDRGLQRTLQHEGRYFAELTGQSWPESGR